MDKLDVLMQHAAELRLDVTWTTDLPPYIHGYYEDAERTVCLNYYCTQAQALSALAHEVGHAIFSDRCSSEAIERRADEMGASFVIEAREYAAAERLVGSHAGALARQLGVTRDLILAWRRWWWRRGRFEAAVDEAA